MSRTRVTRPASPPVRPPEPGKAITLGDLSAGDRVSIDDRTWELAFPFWDYGIGKGWNTGKERPCSWWCREIVEDFGGGELRIDGRVLPADLAASEVTLRTKRDAPTLDVGGRGGDEDPLLARVAKPGTLI